jgi:3-keto-disaccharide hydrolase
MGTIPGVGTPPGNTPTPTPTPAPTPPPDPVAPPGMPPAADASAPAATIPGAAPYGCTTCTRLFNGTNLDGWSTAAGAWVVKEGGVLASTGMAADIYTKEDLGDYRIFFQVRQMKGNHKPCTVMFGKRPADETKAQRSLGGAQFQPPNGASWNYGIGGTFKRLTNPGFDVSMWHQCEVLVKEAGSFRAACCPVGATACKGIEVLDWTGPGKKHPFDIMMHNAGLFDEYREIWIDKAPTGNDLLSMK